MKSIAILLLPAALAALDIKEVRVGIGGTRESNANVHVDYTRGSGSLFASQSLSYSDGPDAYNKFTLDLSVRRGHMEPFGLVYGAGTDFYYDKDPLVEYGLGGHGEIGAGLAVGRFHFELMPIARLGYLFFKSEDVDINNATVGGDGLGVYVGLGVQVGSYWHITDKISVGLNVEWSHRWIEATATYDTGGEAEFSADTDNVTWLLQCGIAL